MIATERAQGHVAQLRHYFDGDGFDRWVAIYESQEELSYIRRTVREGHQMMLIRARQWLDDVRGGEAGTLLDAGCGTGLFSIMMAHQGYDVTGIDIAPRMVALAQQAAGNASARFEAGDIQSSAGRYDAVTCFDVLVHYPRDLFVPLLQHLAHRTEHTLLITYAPYKRLLAAMHWVGGHFPKGNRRTEIQMIPDVVVRDALAEVGMSVRRSEAISRGFYHVKLLQAVRV